MRGTWLAQSEHTSLVLGVVSSSSHAGCRNYLKIKSYKRKILKILENYDEARICNW